MAVEEAPERDVFEELEENALTCAVCLGVFEDPRALDCHHVFCRSCLEHLPLVNEDGINNLGCPTCRHLVPLPPNGVAGFRVSFQTNTLIAFIKANRGRAPAVAGTRNKQTCGSCTSENVSGFCAECKSTFCDGCTDLHLPTCTVNKDTADNGASGIDKTNGHHHAPMPLVPAPSGQSDDWNANTNTCVIHRQTADMFCENCEETICSRCVRRFPHTEHESSCIPLAEALVRYRELLEDRLNPINKEIDFISTQLKPFSHRESEITEQGDTVKTQIHSRAEFLIAHIIKSEEELSEKVDQVIKSKLHSLGARRESIEETQEELRNLKYRIELCLKTGNQEDLLRTKQWIPKINHVMFNIDATKLKPSEVADLSFDPDEVSDNLTRLGNLSSTFEGKDPSCDVQILNQSFFVDKSPDVTLVLSVKYTNLPIVNIPLPSMKCLIKSSSRDYIKAVISLGDTDHQYVVKFHPTSNGLYKLSLKIADIETEDQAVLIPFNPMYLPNITPTTVMKYIRKPIGLAVAQDKRIIVLNDFNEVVILDKHGRNLRTLSRPNNGNRFTSTRHAAVTSDGCFLMTDQYSILKVTMDGQLLKTIGKKGNGRLQFNTPFGITIDEKTGKIYVADLLNHRIQVLNRDYSFSHFFGSRGKAMGQFEQPNGTAIDSQGNIFVTDTFNHRIQKFSQSGEYLSYFGSEGPNPGQLKLPEKIVINNDYIYVTEHLNARVSVFTTEGNFVRCFGKQSSEGGLVWPRGLTFDEDGNLYVCDFRSHCIFKY